MHAYRTELLLEYIVQHRMLDYTWDRLVGYSSVFTSGNSGEKIGTTTCDHAELWQVMMCNWKFSVLDRC